MSGAWYFPWMPRQAPLVNLTEPDRQELECWVAAHRTPQQVSQRCRIILAAAQGRQDKLIADDMDLNFKTVALWRRRFISEGPDCLWEVAEGRGCKPPLTPEEVGSIVDATLQTKPAGATHWSCRSMAKAQGVSKATVNRIWQSHQIKPHLSKGFKLSRDPNFLQKLTDVVGLYLNPPEKALVLCVDEKSQIQALDRTQPGLPMKKGRCGTRTHDYKRNGTTTLFAALDFLQGRVIGHCYERHRHQEFLKFLRQLDQEFPGDTPLRALATLERTLGSRLFLCTQNVDNLHEQAGSRPLHMHGELFKSRCERCQLPFDDTNIYHEVPLCACGGKIRPHICWFGERPFGMDRVLRTLEVCTVFIAIGTSGVGEPAAI